jgi:aromatic ring-opening dioxygenase catalytic subunit (LigB family)
VGTLVGVFACPHNPLLWRTLQGDVADDLVATRDAFAAMRERIAELRPDVLVVVGTDHMTQWFHDNMPTFLVGRAEELPATFYNEEREFGIPTDVVPGDAALGLDLLRSGIDAGIDFASSQSLRIDHSIYLPYAYLSPSRDVPVVPVFTNCIAPPVPGPERFYRLGEVLRDAVAATPLDRRVVIVASGHLATEVGGPRQFRGSPDPAFDTEAMTWLGDGKVEEIFTRLTLERMLRAGNVTPQFLNFVVAMGAAGGAPAVSAVGLVSRFASSPFVEWQVGGPR